MAFINKILSKFLGSKADKDMTEIAPILEEIKKEYERIKLLSNDELRAESARLKELIQERIKPEEDRIKELKELVDAVEIQESEKIYLEIDKLESEISAFNNKIDELNTGFGFISNFFNMKKIAAEKEILLSKRDHLIAEISGAPRH